jgi:osmoprotectant transport system substrate-binding protein
MTGSSRLRLATSLIGAAVLSLVLAACGGDEQKTDGEQAPTVTPIEASPDNEGVKLTVGARDTTEQRILGEIFAQALEAAGYDVSTDLELASESAAVKAVEDGAIDGYPEYTTTALVSILGYAPEEIEPAAGEARADAAKDLEKKGLVAYGPSNFESSATVAMLRKTGEKLQVETLSDLKGESKKLTLAGPPGCEERYDCLGALEDAYGLQFESFTPVDPKSAFEVLDDKKTDASIVSSSAGQLFDDPEAYRLLADDKDVMPPGNVLFIASRTTLEEAGPSFAETIERVQSRLTLPIMQELNANVESDKSSPKEAAQQYLEDEGFVE